MNHRIRLFTQATQTHELREVVEVWRNDYEDILVKLDAGQTIQFTPREKVENFDINLVKGIEQDEHPAMSTIYGACVPIFGDFRLVASDPVKNTTKAKRKAGPGRPKGYDTKTIKRVMAAVDAAKADSARGYIAAASDNLGMKPGDVKRIVDAQRHRKARVQ